VTSVLSCMTNVGDIIKHTYINTFLIRTARL